MVQRRYPHAVVAALVKLSSGTCYWPQCSQPIVVIVEGEPSFNFQIAHIKALNSGGPRYDDSMSDGQRNSFGNLILLCRPHHDYVDRINPGKYSTATLLHWKKDAESTEMTSALSNHLGQVGTDAGLLLLDNIKSAMDQQVEEVQSAVAQLQEGNQEASTAIRDLVDRLDGYQLIGNYLDVSQLDSFYMAVHTLRTHLDGDLIGSLVNAVHLLNDQSIGELYAVANRYDALISSFSHEFEQFQGVADGVFAARQEIGESVGVLQDQLNRLEELRRHR